MGSSSHFPLISPLLYLTHYILAILVVKSNSNKMWILASDSSNLQVLDFWARLFVIPFNVATIWVAFITHQDNSTYGNLDFSHLIGFKYMICTSVASAIFAVVGAAASYLKLLHSKKWFFFLADQAIAYLMVASLAAQWEFLYLAYYGDLEVSWSQGCDSYGSFCNRLKVTVCLHAIALSCFLLLSLISAFRLFTTFQPPFLPSNQDQN